MLESPPQFNKCPKCGNKKLGIFSFGSHEQIFCPIPYYGGCGDWWGPMEALGHYKLPSEQQN